MENEKMIMPENHKRRFESYDDFYRAFSENFSYKRILIYDKAIINHEMTDSPGSVVKAVWHKITDSGANLNVYENEEVVYYFRLNNRNIRDFSLGFE